MKNLLGLRQNWQQFSLLVLINALVGGMIGLERSIFPRLANEVFAIQSAQAIFSFIIVFGITKALFNYLAGHFANQMGRKNVLMLGWVFAIPIPFIFMWAPSWSWIVAANVLLGINQGLTWSSTVTMKIDLVGNQNRGLAMGINEFAGYVSVGIVAFLTGWLADQYGLRPYPFYLGIAFVFFGLVLTILFVQDTGAHVQQASETSILPRLKSVLWDTTWRHPNLGSVTQAGLMNNLNDGMVWGLFPMLLHAKGFSLVDIGLITAIYPLVWGVAQLFTGGLADLICSKALLQWGMFSQGITLMGFVYASSFTHYAILSVFLGLGTAIVYPTFLTAISSYTHPLDRAKSLGVFRFWRDLGYAMGALMTGVLLNYFGYEMGIWVIALLTVTSAIIVWRRMSCREIIL
ncbi:MFS transporter [Aquirufa sp. 5-AUSEE-100C1]|jgi:MFS family permease